MNIKTRQRPFAGLTMLLAYCLIAPANLRGQTLNDYIFSPSGTTWATYWYPPDNNLGYEVDSGSCVGSPAIIENKFSYHSGLGEAINYPIFFPPLLSAGAGHWLPAAAQYVGTPSLFPVYGSISVNISGGVTSNYLFATSNSGIMTITESGSINLSPSALNEITGVEFWSGKETINLNTGEDTWQFVAHESGTGPNGCTFTGNLSANSHFFITVALELTAPPSTAIELMNPAGSNAGHVLPLPTSVSPSTVLNSPSASALSADGHSASVIVYQSPSDDPVTLALTTTTPGASSLDLGSLSAFEPTFLSTPTPGKTAQITLNDPINRSACVAATNPPPCEF